MTAPLQITAASLETVIRKIKEGIDLTYQEEMIYLVAIRKFSLEEAIRELKQYEEVNGE